MAKDSEELKLENLNIISKDENVVNIAGLFLNVLRQKPRRSPYIYIINKHMEC